MTDTPRPRALDRVTPIVREEDSTPIRKMKKMMEESPDMLSLAMGEANFAPPEALVQAACRVMQQGNNLYTSTAGIPSVRAALADFAQRRWGVGIDPEEMILLTVGGMEAIHLAARVLVEPGDRVLLPDPGWGIIRPVMQRLGADVNTYPLYKEGGTWTIDAKEICARVRAQGKDAVKLVVVNSPSNPTGAVLDREGWQLLIDSARNEGFFVLSDEVYHNYTYDGTHVSGLEFEALENLVVVNSFSKTFAVTGWRLGWTVSDPWIIRQMTVYKESISLCSFGPGQWALAEFLPKSDTYLAWAQDLCRRNMERAADRLAAVPGVECARPQGGFYLFPDLSGHEPSSQALWERLLRAGVAVVAGAFFGSNGEGHARIGFAAPWEQIEPALERLEEELRG